MAEDSTKMTDSPADEAKVTDKTDVSENEATEVKAKTDSNKDVLSSLQAELEKAKEQIASLKDQGLRAQAELQNVKRRAVQDVEKAHKFVLSKFAKSLLEVVDSLELALANSKEEDAVHEGVSMTLKLFISTLAKHGVEQIDPEGHPFDPELHQAMSIQESNEVEPNTVTAVVQKGYVLNGRLVRPAMVMVSKAGNKAADEKKSFDA